MFTFHALLHHIVYILSVLVPTRIYVNLLLSALVVSLIGCDSATPRLPETTNSIGITLVTIPAGSFAMGETDPHSIYTAGGNTAYPQHTVTVPSFQLAKTEITVGQYKKYLMSKGRDGERALQDTEFLKYNSFGDDAPAVNLSMRNVSDFLKWLNSIDGDGYRLPSEAEWEHACRAGGNDTFCGGNDIDSLGWTDENSNNRTHPVAKKQPNAFGLYDMSGNAEEWTADCYHSDYNGAPTDGSAWASSERECQFYVVRGGAWNMGAGGPRATKRDRKSPDYNFSTTGFRIARSIATPAKSN